MLPLPTKLRRALALLASGALLSSAALAQPANSYDVPETLDLDTALRFALDHNFEILKAKQRIEEQNGLILEVRAQALPNVSVDGNYTELDSGLSEPFPGFPPTEQRWSVALQARQALYKGGGVRAALRAQEFVEQAAMLELQAVINEQLFLVREGFYAVLLARASIQVQEESVALLEQQLQNARDRVEVGTASQFEALRAEVELANARPDLIRARNAHRLAIEELRQTLGFFAAKGDGLGKAPEFVGELEYQPIQYDMADSIERALASRPELLRLERVFEARQEGIAIARSGMRPDVDLVGSYGYNRSSLSNQFDDALDGWTVGLEFNVPVFDGFRTKGQVVQARSQADQAQLDLQQAALSVEVDVRRSLSQLQEASELSQASVKVVDQAEESLRLADARYGAGEATQLDVLQARVALTEARLNQVEAYYSFNVAVAAARRAMGEGGAGEG